MRGWVVTVVWCVLLGLGCAGAGRNDFDGDGAEDDVDCDPGDASVWPGAPDSVSDGIDQSCDGVDGVDGDGDGYASVASGGDDCNDALDTVHVAAAEIPDNEVDEDCDGEALLCDQDDDGVLRDHPLCGGADCDDRNAGCTAPSDCDDNDGDLQRRCDLDCDDFDPTRFQGNPEVCDGADNDCNAEVPANEVDADADTWRICGGDCDDGDAGVHPTADEGCDGRDTDCDGGLGPDEQDDDGDGAPACVDCDDGDPGAHPGAVEVPYDGIDQDCVGGDLVDVDGDGHAALPFGADCDDNDPLSWPGASDAPDNGADNNCDGIPGVDADGDGSAAFVADCDDGDATVFPGATELCDGIDQDCDGVPSAAFGGTESDGDGDGALACADCDDGDAAVAPGLAEVCDGADTDCDGQELGGDEDADGDGDLGCAGCGAGLVCADCDDADPLLSTLDLDGDGETSCGTDCDDGDPLLNTADQDADAVTSCDGDCSDFNPAVRPGVPEACDGVDTDCDGAPLAASDEVDLDGDTWIGCADCDDGEPLDHPGAAERCDGVDGDCDGVVPANELDGDGDGYVACAGWFGATAGVLGGGDCDPTEPLTWPGAAEQCDLEDNDCDGVIDDGVDSDGDGDGWFPCQGDCDDGDPARFPMNLLDASPAGRVDGVDGNCDGEDEFRASGASTTITGLRFFGSALAADGDVDGDGKDDVLVTLASSNQFEGVFLFLGGNLDPGAMASGEADAFLPPPANADIGKYTRALTFLGDLDGDGADDFAVAGAGASPAVWIVSGAEALAGTMTDLSGSLASIAMSEVFAVTSVPDLDGDGLDELLVGSAWSTGALTNVGRVDLFLGSTLAAGGALTPSDAWTQLIGDTERQALGHSLTSAADLDGDGLCEVAVSGLGAGGSSAVAPVVLLLGGATLLSGGGAVPSDAIATIGPTPGVPTRFPEVAQLPDVTGDGVDDLVLGAYWGFGHSLVFSGSALVAGGAFDASDAQWTLLAETVSGANYSDPSLRSIRGGDIDGDGVGDIVFGRTGSNIGRAYITLGASLGATLPTGGTMSVADTDYAFWETDPSAPNDLGHAVALGDLNGNGRLDVVLAGNAQNASTPGTVHVLLDPL